MPKLGTLTEHQDIALLGADRKICHHPHVLSERACGGIY